MTAEFVRRAERGLGVAIREGQDRGEVIAKGKNLHPETIARLEVDDIDFKAPRPVTDFAPKHELSGITGEGGIYAMTDGVSDGQFEEAITEAKSEGNLSRANVARKCKAKSKPVIDAEGTVAILAAILAGTPRLPGAACRDHVGLYDAAADGGRDAAQEAVDICRRCPVLDACERWAERAYPQKKPAGVLAGQFAPPTNTRKARIA